MADPDKNDQSKDSLTTYQKIALSTVRRWLIYVTCYALAVLLLAVTLRSSNSTFSEIFPELLKDPAIWGVVLMPPLLMIFMRWSVMDMVTQLHNLDADQSPLEDSIFSEADSLTEPVKTGQSFELYTLLNQIIECRETILQQKEIKVSIEVHHDIPNNLAGQLIVLKSVLNELFDSAIERSEKSSIYVGARLLEQSHGKFLLRFEVGDSGTGYGISENSLLRCQDLLATVGGQIGEHNKQNLGQTVWFTIILQKEHGQTVAA